MIKDLGNENKNVTIRSDKMREWLLGWNDYLQVRVE